LNKCCELRVAGYAVERLNVQILTRNTNRATRNSIVFHHSNL